MPKREKLLVWDHCDYCGRFMIQSEIVRGEPRFFSLYEAVDKKQGPPWQEESVDGAWNKSKLKTLAERIVRKEKEDAE